MDDHFVTVNLQNLGIVPLPPPTSPKGNYVPCIRTGNYLYLSGHLPILYSNNNNNNNKKKDNNDNDEGTGTTPTTTTTTTTPTMVKGTLGKDLTIEQGYQAAEACGIQILATLHSYLNGDWSKVKQIVKIVGFVACTDDFEDQPSVVNGVSDLMVKVFGPDIGRHARSAVGTNALPLNIATEIECIVEISDC